MMETTVEQALELLQKQYQILAFEGERCGASRGEVRSIGWGRLLTFGRQGVGAAVRAGIRGPQTVGELRGRTERMQRVRRYGRSREHVLESAGRDGSHPW